MTRPAKFGEPWSHHGAYAFDRKDVMTLDAPDEVIDGKEEGVVRARGTGAGRTFERQEEIMARVVALVNAAAGLTTEQATDRLALPEPAPADGWTAVGPKLLRALQHMHWCRGCAEGPWEDCEEGRAAQKAMAEADALPSPPVVEGKP